MLMEGGRQLVSLTVRLKPLQIPVLSLVPPFAPATGPAPRARNLGHETPHQKGGYLPTYCP